MKKLTMQQQIIFLFICLSTFPLLIIFTIASNIFTTNTKQDLQTLYSANINEIGNKIDAVFTNALELSTYPLMEESLRTYLTSEAPTDSADYLLTKLEAANSLNSLPFSYVENIHGIGLYTENGDNIISNSNVRLTEEDYAALSISDSNPYWDFSRCEKSHDYIYLMRHLKNPTDLSQYIGYIKLAVTGSGLKEILMKFQQESQTSYFIVTPENELALWLDAGGYINSDKDLPEYGSLYKKISSGTHSWINGDIITSCYHLNNGLILYSITSPEILNSIRQTFRFSIGTAEIFIFIFTLLLSFYFSKLITAPLRQLGEHMTELSKECFSDRIPITGCREIQILSGHYNHMAERLEYLYNEVYMGELRLKQSRLEALQSQLNPHFLYNTLDTIYWMSKMGDSENTSIMVSNLSKMMRMTLEPAGNTNLVSLGYELEHLTCYISIQQIRYGNKIRFSITCDNNLKTLSVLRLLLQPLVENALVHGLPHSTNGVVSIRIYKKETVLIYDVANNGIPADINEMQKLIHSKPVHTRGLAIYNINERIRLKYGNTYGLTCFLDGSFTVFRITQPLIEHSENSGKYAPGDNTFEENIS